MGVSCLLAVGFTVSDGNNVEAKAETGVLGVSWTDTKYKVSKEGDYALIITAFKADEVLANAENKNYIIGYEINGEDALVEYGKNYYESVSLKTSETESVAYTAAQVFGETYADYKLNVYEINEFDVNADYTVQPFIKEIALDGDNGYNVVAEDVGAENTIDVKTVTFDTKGGEVIAPIYVQNGATFGEMPVAVKENCEFGRWSENLTGKTITQDVTVSVMWKVEDITGQFDWANGKAYYANANGTYASGNFGVRLDSAAFKSSAFVDVSQYVGKTLQITMPKSTNYGLLFEDGTSNGPGSSAGTKMDEGWWMFQNDTAEGKVMTITIPEGAKRLKTTYYADETDKIPFSAKILDGYTVNFDTKGGTAIPSQFVWYGETVQVPENPTLAGATFQGWDTDLTQPVTGAMTVTASYKLAEVDITDQFIWSTQTGGIYVKDGESNFGKVFSTSSNFAYTTQYVDVSAYVGRTLQIMLPKSNYGLVFATEDVYKESGKLVAYSVWSPEGTKREEGWYVFPAQEYASETAKCIVANIVIPEGAKYLKTTYWMDGSQVDGYIEFYAKILGGTI